MIEIHEESSSSSSASKEQIPKNVQDLLSKLPPPPEKPPTPPKLNFHIIIIQGRNFASENVYVNLQIGKKSFKTSTKQSKEFCPKWSEDFHFEDVELTEKIVLTAKDGDDDSTIGKVSSSLSDFEINGVLDEWNVLKTVKSGEIRAAFQLATEGEKPFSDFTYIVEDVDDENASILTRDVDIDEKKKDKKKGHKNTGEKEDKKKKKKEDDKKDDDGENKKKEDKKKDKKNEDKKDKKEKNKKDDKKDKGEDKKENKKEDKKNKTDSKKDKKAENEEDKKVNKKEDKKKDKKKDKKEDKKEDKKDDKKDDKKNKKDDKKEVKKEDKKEDNKKGEKKKKEEKSKEEIVVQTRDVALELSGDSSGSCHFSLGSYGSSFSTSFTGYTDCSHSFSTAISSSDYVMHKKHLVKVYEDIKPLRKIKLNGQIVRIKGLNESKIKVSVDLQGKVKPRDFSLTTKLYEEKDPKINESFLIEKVKQGDSIKIAVLDKKDQKIAETIIPFKKIDVNNKEDQKFTLYSSSDPNEEKGTLVIKFDISVSFV